MRKHLVGFSLLMSILCCSTLVDNNMDVKCDTSLEQAAYAIPQFKWMVDDLLICWENPDPKYEDDMAMAEYGINSSWGVNIPINLIWSNECDDNSNVRITIQDVRPYADVGQLEEGPSHISLNFEMNNWGKGHPDKTRDEKILYEANHEFGHTLGFLHEQDRPDAPETNKCEFTGEEGYTTIGPYDPNSVMNYCANTFWPDCQDLSAARQIYGY